MILAYVCVKRVLSDRTSAPFRSNLGLTMALQVSLVGHINQRYCPCYISSIIIMTCPYFPTQKVQTVSVSVGHKQR